MLCIRGTRHGPVSVCPSQVGVLLKRLNVGSRKQHHTIAQGGRPVRTKSRQNESLFRSNGTRVFVLLGFRSDGISFQRDRALQRVAH